jgi:hypothetical protein
LKPSKCDACNRRLRRNQHELHLSDPRTGQVIGRYHTGEPHADCMAAAEKYLTSGAILMATVVHPDSCQECCDVGLADMETLA